MVLPSLATAPDLRIACAGSAAVACDGKVADLGRCTAGFPIHNSSLLPPPKKKIQNLYLSNNYIPGSDSPRFDIGILKVGPNPSFFATPVVLAPRGYVAVSIDVSEWQQLA